jgi:hypothetical protein
MEATCIARTSDRSKCTGRSGSRPTELLHARNGPSGWRALLPALLPLPRPLLRSSALAALRGDCTHPSSEHGAWPHLPRCARRNGCSSGRRSVMPASLRPELRLSGGRGRRRRVLGRHGRRLANVHSGWLANAASTRCWNGRLPVIYAWSALAPQNRRRSRGTIIHRRHMRV